MTSKLPRAFFSLLAILMMLCSLVNAEEEPQQYEFKPHEKHLCAKITDGHFDRIHIKSITFYKENKLVIFEDAYKYYIERELINETTVPLSGFNREDWDANELFTGVQQMVNGEKRLNRSQVIAVYLLYFGNVRLLHPGAPNVETGGGVRVRWDRTKLAAVLYTRGTVYTMDILHPKEPSLYYDHQNNHPPFAIIQDQKTDGGPVDGYVINRDIYDRTNNLVIYDLQTSYKSLVVRIHRKSKITQAEIDSAAFYYIEKGPADNEILLVHRQRRKKTPADEKAQLSTTVPRGFRLGSNVYLVDSNIGCVYLLKGLTMRLSDNYKKSQENIRVKVVGIPFERFFKCREVKVAEPYPHEDGRCQLSRNRAPPLQPLNVSMSSTTPEEDGDNTLAWLIFVFIVVLVVCFVIGLFAFKYGRQWEQLPLTSMKPFSRSALLHQLALEKAKRDREQKRKLPSKKTKTTTEQSSSKTTSKSASPRPGGQKHSPHQAATRTQKKNLQDVPPTESMESESNVRKSTKKLPPPAGKRLEVASKKEASVATTTSEATAGPIASSKKKVDEETLSSEQLTNTNESANSIKSNKD